MIRRGINATTLPVGRHLLYGIISDKFIGNVVVNLNYESLLRAWGHIRAFRLKEKPSCRAVVICYPPDELRQLIDLARRDGVEFLTPEEVVAEFGPGSSSGE